MILFSRKKYPKKLFNGASRKSQYSWLKMGLFYVPNKLYWLSFAQIECLTSSCSAHCYFRALHEKTSICYSAHRRFGCKMAIICSSKLQIFDKGENRYVLFGCAKQHNLREFLPRSWLKVLRSFFKSDHFLFVTSHL